ncbi:hypothetical protein HANVADRAFT_50335 [Hanseniaspora valbyensis NRRL Y-1626]|uniref:Uncharacterized protein n=1 Tax=Hanseniaspora valbyensis NRRL Y-1626 TaxID=766949 RepID=A0A1B7T8Q7_9ASCO|nr:hypothetical protein HANVADRAFT_50335 [Hanseniaspora valbyensis NRRL Y-1626]
MESINSINSFKRSSSSILSNSNASSQIPMKNLKKYLTTGDEAYLADGNGEEDSDEDLFMNNLYHQQQRKQQQDLMVNMTSSANLYALDEAEESVDEEEIERIKRETKKVDPSRSSTLGKVDSIDIDMGLNFGSHLLKATGSNNLSSDSNLKANNSKEYKKITPIDLYGDSDEIQNEDDKENDYIPSCSWFLGGNT